jgi:hypothetical protein
MNRNTIIEEALAAVGPNRQLIFTGDKVVCSGQVNSKNTGYELLELDSKPQGYLYFCLQEVDSYTDLKSLGGSLSLP